MLSFVPSALRAILSIDGAERAFRGLRILDLHGERILASDIALFRSKLPRSCHISVTMGSIEAGAVFSWFVVDVRSKGRSFPSAISCQDVAWRSWMTMVGRLRMEKWVNYSVAVRWPWELGKAAAWYRARSYPIRTIQVHRFIRWAT